MTLLLDTHIVLRELAGRRALGRAARAAIEQATELLFSVVSFAEVGVKVAIGKLSLPPDFHGHVVHSGVADRRFAAYDVRLIETG